MECLSSGCFVLICLFLLLFSVCVMTLLFFLTWLILVLLMLYWHQHGVTFSFTFWGRTDMATGLDMGVRKWDRFLSSHISWVHSSLCKRIIFPVDTELLMCVFGFLSPRLASGGLTGWGLAHMYLFAILCSSYWPHCVQPRLWLDWLLTSFISSLIWFWFFSTLKQSNICSLQLFQTLFNPPVNWFEMFGACYVPGTCLVLGILQWLCEGQSPSTKPYRAVGNIDSNEEMTGADEEQARKTREDR